MKKCFRCKEEKSDIEFVKRKGKVGTYCLICNRLRFRQYLKTPEGRNLNRKAVTKTLRPQPSFIYRNVIISFLIRRDGFQCGFCGLSLENAQIHIDHIKPRALGGLDEMDNLRLAHAQCNTKESSKIRLLKAQLE